MSTPAISQPGLRERLPRLAREALPLLQQLHAHRRRWQLGSAGSAFWIEIVPVEACMAARVSIVLNGVSAELQLHSSQLQEIGELDWSDYQGSARLTAWTLAHQRTLKQLTRLFDSIVLPQAMLADDAPRAADLIMLGFKMGQADQTIDRGVLHVPLSALQHLLGRAGSQTPGTARDAHWNQLPVPLRISLRGPAMAWTEWRSLQPGDVIVLGRRAHALAEMSVADEASATCWQASWCGNGVRIESPAAPPMDDTGNHPMNEENDHDVPADADVAAESMEPVDPLTHLPLAVEFVLGEASLPLGELAQLQPGYVFPLQADIDNARVGIRANGRTVGYGRLVAVGDTLAVQLENWSKDGLQ